MKDELKQALIRRRVAAWVNCLEAAIEEVEQDLTAQSDLYNIDDRLRMVSTLAIEKYIRQTRSTGVW